MALFEDSIMKNTLHLLLKNYLDVDASNFKDLKKLIYKVKPNYLINCIGIIKQLDESKDYVQSITINSLLPHILLKQR